MSVPYSVGWCMLSVPGIAQDDTNCQYQARGRPIRPVSTRQSVGNSNCAHLCTAVPREHVSGALEQPQVPLLVAPYAVSVLRIA